MTENPYNQKIRNLISQGWTYNPNLSTHFRFSYGLYQTSLSNAIEMERFCQQGKYDKVKCAKCHVRDVAKNYIKPFRCRKCRSENKIKFDTNVDINRHQRESVAALAKEMNVPIRHLLYRIINAGYAEFLKKFKEDPETAKREASLELQH